MNYPPVPDHGYVCGVDGSGHITLAAVLLVNGSVTVVCWLDPDCHDATIIGPVCQRLDVAKAHALRLGSRGNR